MSTRLAPDGLEMALRATHAVRATVDSWRGGDLLAARLPVLDGELTEAADQTVPERVSLTVPRYDPRTGVDYTPSDPALSPLGHYGQRLAVGRVVERAGAEPLAVQLGWFRVEGWDLEGDSIRVEALGLLAVIDQAKLLSPTAPPVGATFRSEFRRLVEGLLPVDLSASPADRAVPRSFAWDSDRLASLAELCAAWPARMYVDADGVLNVAAPHADATDPADLVLTEGDPQLGTVVSLGYGGSRDGVANVVVARGEQTDDPARGPVQGIAYDLAGPSAYGTVYGPAPAFYASPLLTTTAQAQAAAATRLATLRRPSVTRSVVTVPDPRISAAQGTRVDLHRASGAVERCRALTVNLPLTALGGAATYGLAVL